MRYSIESRDRVSIKGYGFLLLEVWVIKTASKRAIQKTAEATGDLVGNKIADKITSVSKRSTKKLPTIAEDVELTTHKRYISAEERQQIIDELRLIPKN